MDGPYANAKAGERPPLVKGMFVEVELRTKPLKGKIIVPSASISDSQVFVVNAESRLQRRAIKIGYRGDGFVIVDEGLKEGDKVVVSELQIATPNMLLKPSEDEDLRMRMQQLSGDAEVAK